LTGIKKENPPNSLNAADSLRLKVKWEGGEKVLVLLNRNEP
jgi:hypothetical protein